MGSKIKLTDTSGKRIQKKPRTNQIELSSTSGALLINDAPVGGGIPGGVDGNIQVNNDNVFGGLSGFSINPSYNLTVGQGNTQVNSYSSNIIGGGFLGSIVGIYGSNTSGHSIFDSIGSLIAGGGLFAQYDEILGLGHIISATTSAVIIGGIGNQIGQGVGNSIFGSVLSVVSGSNSSAIIASNAACLKYGDHSVIIGAKNSPILCNSQASLIIGGNGNNLHYSDDSAIIGGHNLTLVGYDCTVLVPSLKINELKSAIGSVSGIGIDICGNVVPYTVCGGSPTVPGGTIGSLQFNNMGSFDGVYDFCIDTSRTTAVLGAKSSSNNTSTGSTVIGGNQHMIYNSNYSSILGGTKTSLRGGNSDIALGGTSNTFCNSVGSVIIGGNANAVINGLNSGIIGGNNLTLANYPNTILVPNIQVNGTIKTFSGGTAHSGVTASVNTGLVTLNILNGIIIGYA